jgi:hypothetical protein
MDVNVPKTYGPTIRNTWGEPAKERHVRVESLVCVVVLSITTGAAYATGPTQAELNDAVNDGTAIPTVPA